ncbi:MAG: hypothetical protein SV686_11990 [Thermodesulfobacteriota bacterium]|nr:hypothetical protein [Thermodesulfobacteriota bacterium]
MRTLPDDYREDKPYQEIHWSRHLSHHEILTIAETLGDFSPVIVSVFREVLRSVLPFLTRKEFDQWVLLGKTVYNGTPAGVELCTNYLQSSPKLISTGSFYHLKGWVEQGLELAKRSSLTALLYFQITPTFLERGEIFHLRPWGDTALQILSMGDKKGEAAVSFLKGSADLLQFVPFRQLKDWIAAGIDMVKQSPGLASLYFALKPKGLDLLYATEILRIFQLCFLISKTHPEKALELYENSPQTILDLSPTVRGMAMDAAKKISSDKPEGMVRTLEGIAANLALLTYPDQESVLENEIPIGEISIKASKAYLNHVGILFETIPETFLPHWVDKGLSILKRDEQRGINYFSLNSKTCRKELSQLKEAILLEDHQHLLTLYAHALSGEELRLKSTKELDPDESSPLRDYPSCDGHTIFLPPFAAGEEEREENFRNYKIAVAHQAGCVEFGSFESGFPIILSILHSFPIRALAKDIFFILEDGRIDRKLTQEYRGLKQEMDLVLSRAMKRRPPLCELPIQEALVEVLLRFTLDCLDEGEVPPDITEHLFFIKENLKGFYEEARGIWDCYNKTLILYDYLSRLPTSSSYLPSIPLYYRGRLDPELFPDPGPWQCPPDEILGDRHKEGQAVSISMEDLERILDRLKDSKDLEFIQGEELSSQGLSITDTEGVTTKSSEDDRCEYEQRNQTFFLPATHGKTGQEGPFYYDEWDYRTRTYRRKWCCLRERVIEPLESGLVDEIYKDHMDLIQKVKRQFQRIRPEVLEIVRSVEWGDEIDFPAMIRSVVEKKAGSIPSEKVFTRREKKTRRISTLFLMDMSASTDELIPNEQGKKGKDKKVIDIEIESLVVMMEALEALADEYAIFGFSGYGREHVDFYRIKDFSDNYSESLKRRISNIRPKQGTRMGPVIRHAIEKLRSMESDQRLLLLLSDGFPQDHGYGEDRRSNEYALHDTMMALLEAKKEGIQPFCITMDQGGHDYLRKMCDPRSYLVIQDIYSLPEKLPNIVESLMSW